MAFKTRTIEDLISAQAATAQLLREEVRPSVHFSFRAAIILYAAAEVLERETTFCGEQITETTGLKHRDVNRTLKTLVGDSQLPLLDIDEIDSRYYPTELGKRALEFYK